MRVAEASENAGTGSTAVLQRRLATASSSDLSLNPSFILLSLHRSSFTVSHLSSVPQPICCVTPFEVGHQRPWKHCLILHCSFIHLFLFHYAFHRAFVEPAVQTLSCGKTCDHARQHTHTHPLIHTHKHTHRSPNSSGKALRVRVLVLQYILSRLSLYRWSPRADIFGFNF